jgi:hypothetical protein
MKRERERKVERKKVETIKYVCGDRQQQITEISG